MRRSYSGNLRNLPKPRYESRLLQCWLARRLAQLASTATQRVPSCLPSSTHPQTNAHNQAPQGDPSWYSLSVAPAHTRSKGFRRNPAHATQLFPDAGADQWQSGHSLANDATFHDDHVWARRHSSGTPGSINGWAYWQRLMLLSRRTRQAQLPHKPSCGKFSLTDFSGALCWCLSHLRCFPTSQLSVDFAMALASACPALLSVLPT